MFLSRMLRFHLSALGGLAVAAAALLVAAGPASAQRPAADRSNSGLMAASPAAAGACPRSAGPGFST